ncbi:hypothetical protein K470DRAFT_178575 [Piedraia hortae CBS 480.64]|uniref:CsbD-like domain-containing protein n=1 Tax=Piedraia hortae CBS 480.64 TaxID=1314780 RepID=A0A6A7BPS8_9PEZI|nr:hypothetical protein K470DRAFT_178575 [Piedraia hortae CBS 480.64]
MPSEDSKANAGQSFAKGVTSTVGNAAGGLTRTVGGIVGATGKGVGETINKTTGTTAVGDSLQSLTGGLEKGATQAGKGAENAGEWKKP